MDDKTKELLKRLMDRPESLDSMDVAPETDDSAAMVVEAPAEEYEVPEDVAAGVEQAVESGDEMIAGMPNKSYQEDSEITAAIRKLKAGQPNIEEVEVTPETIADPSADVDLRKAALEKVKQKYLGR